MRIRDIEITASPSGRTWHVPLPAADCVCVYGPNEAGKSTLLQFLRGMLYGFPAPGWAGHLAGDVEGREFRLTRQADDVLELAPLATGESAAPLLRSWLGGIDAPVYSQVFAVGLRDLQELATLEDSAAAGLLYELALGPAGQAWLAQGEVLRDELKTLADPERRTGRVLELQARRQTLTTELRNLRGALVRTRDLRRAQQELAAGIADLTRRQRGIQEQQRGQAFLERVWGPWNRVQTCDRELAQTEAVRDFPPRGAARLKRLEQTLAETQSALAGLRTRLRGRRPVVAPDDGARPHALAAAGLLSRRDALRPLQAQAQALQQESQALQADLQRRLAALGRGWDAARLEKVDASSAAQFKLSGVARTYKAAQTRRGRHQQACARLEAAIQKRTAELREQLAAQGGRTVDEVRERHRTAARLRTESRTRQRQIDALVSRQTHLDEQCGRLEMRLVLPGWVYLVLGLFGLLGVVLAGAGFWTGLHTSGLVGAVYAFLGVSLASVAWTLKLHLEAEVRDQLRRLESAAEANRAELRALRSASPADPGPADAAPRLTRQAFRALRRAAHGLDRARRLLAERQLRLHAREREHATALQAWLDLLNQLGLNRDVSAEAVSEHWQRVTEALDVHRRRTAVLQELARIQPTLQTWEADVRDWSARLPTALRTANATPEALLQTLSTRLQDAPVAVSPTLSAAERTELRELKKRRLKCRVARLLLFVRAGVRTRAEFLDRAQLAARRAQVLQARAAAQADLAAAAATAPELAIVEDDLRAFDPQANRDGLELLQMELDDLSKDLREAHERFGGVKQELQALRTNRRSQELRFERAQVETDLVQALERMAGIQLALDVWTERGRDVERAAQPAIVSAAARRLAQLTAGRYRDLWIPLGARALRLADAQDRPCSADMLSTGTREQLFLALRLALIESLGAAGAGLPVVLDDVLVNFDDQRSADALETLRDFAAGRQVLLFTCHRRLAQMSEASGMPVVELPGPALQAWHRVA